MAVYGSSMKRFNLYDKPVLAAIKAINENAYQIRNMSFMLDAWRFYGGGQYGGGVIFGQLAELYPKNIIMIYNRYPGSYTTIDIAIGNPIELPDINNL